jgi:uncharacterized membrane protein YeaQ/YmgE (transglycosylase-associated protein family)
MDILTLLVVGLVAGVLASVVMRGSGFGLLGNILLGVCGSLVGSWIFRELHWQAPFAGVAGVIAVAFVGAVCVLLVFRLVRRARARR